MDKIRDQIAEKTKELMELVQNTGAYLNYHASLEEIRRDPELYDKLNRFRYRNMLVDFIEDPKERSEENEQIYHEFEEILTRPLTVRFLSSEQKVCRLMKEIYDTIAENVNLDLSHMDLES